MSKPKKLKLTKICLETKNGENIDLGLDEAKDLYDQLHSLFGETKVYIPSAPVVIDRDWWNPSYRQFWSDTTANNPSHPIDVQCSVKADSGLSVSYCGNAI